MTTNRNASLLLAALGELGCAQAAAVYAALGFPVVPMHTAQPGGACTYTEPGCPDLGKHPRLRGWQGLAATDPGLVGEWWRRWPTANLGLVTGRRFDVLDLDGEQGLEALRTVLSIAPTEHPGPVARTGGGGWHLLYAPTGLVNRVGLLPEVALARPRRADRSPHSPGTPAAPSTAGCAPDRAPAHRAGRAAAPPGPAASSRATLPPATSRPGGGYGPAALAGERQAVATAPPGRRNATLNRAAFNLGQLVAARLLDTDEVRAVLLAAALEAGNLEAKARATIGSGLRGGAAKPRRRRDGAA